MSRVQKRLSPLLHFVLPAHWLTARTGSQIAVYMSCRPWYLGVTKVEENAMAKTRITIRQGKSGSSVTYRAKSGNQTIARTYRPGKKAKITNTIRGKSTTRNFSY
jgi:hypothetical protein